MGKVIFVEGPDGSGKSTLVRQLKDKFLFLEDIKSERHGPPDNAQDLYERAKDILVKVIHSPKRCIVDRFGLIGETIYGPACRNHDMWAEIPYKKQEVYTAFNTLDPFMIYCRPPMKVVVSLTNHEVKDYDTPEHLKSLSEHQSLIVKSYDNFFANWKPHNFFIWDYTRPENYYDLIKQLEEYLKW